MGAGRVFADTSALYAFVDSRDEHHAVASKLVGELLQAGRSLVTSDYVVAEAVNLANARGGQHVARRVLDLVRQSAGIQLEWIGPARFATAEVFFRKHADHRYSFTDCTSFMLMRELRLEEAITTDRHFTEAGLRVLWQEGDPL